MKIKGLLKFWPYLIILLLTVLFLGKTLFPQKDQVIYGGDLNDQFYFWKSYLASNLKQGIVPFWNPYSFSGTPFLAHPSTAAFYPLNILFLIFPINSAFSLYLFVHVLLGGVFMYRLCRRLTDPYSSLAGSVVFSLSGLMAARIYSGHIDIISTFVWIPAVFGSVTYAIDNPNRKTLAVSILFLTMQILAGYQAVVVFTLELIFIYQITQIILDRKNIINRMRYFIFIIFVSFGISAVQILPTIEFVRNSIRGQGLPYGLLTWGSYKLSDFLTFVNPFKYGNPFPENYSYTGPGPNFFELSYFSGIVPMILLIAFFLYKLLINKKTDNVFYGLLGSLIFFILVSAGNNFPLHPVLFRLIPFYRLFRFPPQHLIMVVFIMAFVSALAVSKIKNIWVKVIIVFVISLELLAYDKKFIRLTTLPTANFDSKLINFISKDSDLTRLLPDYTVVSSVRKAWDFESSMTYKINSTAGYNPILLSNFYKFIDQVNHNFSSSILRYNVEVPPPDPSSKYMDFLNVKYVLADKNFDEISRRSLDKYLLKLEGDSYRLYENKDFQPRFFVNCKAEEIQKVEVLEYGLNNVRLRTSSDCDGILSTSEVYYPGWIASIDGKAAEIKIINTAFRSIYLTKGDHIVEFYYRPTIYYIGGLITLVSLIILLIVTAGNDNFGMPRVIPKW